MARLESVDGIRRRRVAALRERNRKRREALAETVKAVEEIIRRDEIEIQMLERVLAGEEDRYAAPEGV
jgi:hypothetical protein